MFFVIIFCKSLNDKNIFLVGAGYLRAKSIDPYTPENDDLEQLIK